MGNRVGIENLDKYAFISALAKRLALIYQVRRLALWQSPEYKQKSMYDEDWYLGETFDATIGQSFTLVTPLPNGCFAQRSS